MALGAAEQSLGFAGHSPDDLPGRRYIVYQANGFAGNNGRNVEIARLLRGRKPIAFFVGVSHQLKLPPRPAVGVRIFDTSTRVRCGPHFVTRDVEYNATHRLLGRRLHHAGFGVRMARRLLTCIKAGAQYDALRAKRDGSSKTASIRNTARQRYWNLMPYGVDNSRKENKGAARDTMPAGFRTLSHDDVGSLRYSVLSHSHGLHLA
jgi:hypothetical protein